MANENDLQSLVDNLRIGPGTLQQCKREPVPYFLKCLWANLGTDVIFSEAIVVQSDSDVEELDNISPSPSKRSKEKAPKEEGRQKPTKSRPRELTPPPPLSMLERLELQTQVE